MFLNYIQKLIHIREEIKNITDIYNKQKHNEEAMQHNNGVSAHNAKVDALLIKKKILLIDKLL